MHMHAPLLSSQLEAVCAAVMSVAPLLGHPPLTISQLASAAALSLIRAQPGVVAPSLPAGLPVLQEIDGDYVAWQVKRLIRGGVLRTVVTEPLSEEKLVTK